MNLEALLADFARRGIQLTPDSKGLAVRPASKLTDADREAIQGCKAELRMHLLADEALSLLRRLKCYTPPAGRVPAAREIAERCAARFVLWENGERVSEADEVASILAVLRDIERELAAIGGSLDPELADAVEMVERIFPGARLIKIQ
jgi:hypothetical protein